MDDGRRLDGYTISSPCEPNGSGELIITVLSKSEISSLWPSSVAAQPSLCET